MPLIRQSELKPNFTQRGHFSSYSLILEHSGLNEVKELKAKSYALILQKRMALLETWEKKWARFKEKERIRTNNEAGLRTAAEQTKQAQDKLEQMNKILHHALSVNDAIDWGKLKNHVPFSEPCPVKPELVFVNDQRPNAEEYRPKISLFDYLLPFLAKKKEQKATYALLQAQSDWDDRTARNTKMNQEFARSQDAWERAKKKYENDQASCNKKLDELKSAYLQSVPEAVCECCEIILENSEYPDEFPKSFDLDYNGVTKILIVDYQLPTPEQIPTLKEVAFIASKSELTENHITIAQRNELYDSVVYQIVLRTIHELFEGDIVNAIMAISLNGIVRAINKATGKMETSCILSIQVKKETFEDINLGMVDPKACFKKLRGVGSSKLYCITAVTPIMNISKEDSRFVDAYSVTEDLDNSTNIAAMDWEDFEHLVRELFAQEFSTNGGEVKVTQASKDGGVDAIAFDPDPIRGGKIVIQAKRYTNTVGVSAVRDLYGTVQAEGANKGILVTTADYGPDSYEFAQGKPLTLINGANLLWLLEKHGHRATIDLKAAKKAMAERPESRA